MPNEARRARRWARLLAAGVLAGASLSVHASAQTMIEPERISVAVRGAGTADDDAAMRRVIVDAAARHGWVVSGDRPGCMTLSVSTREHAATVDVLYDGGSFQVKYRTSVEMDYEVDGGRVLIHPGYNKWVTDLGNEIRRGARNAVPQRRRASDANGAAPAGGAASGAQAAAM